ncbi:hypothetical protein RHMOL_Rhmol01G0227800 [Rhododendron molle]|uniref:Uncharacterized protein n=1 Tax=Rhododendron molle TaxID=49168 RepID=A0ACC0Q5U2_RHOML|nr:hypothetical protein RHMOL_Rhmol01G0227800 [Rhododendron molle]
MLMNLQNRITAMQQRAIQIDANITRLNDLINTRLPPPLEEEGEDDEDDQKDCHGPRSESRGAPHCSNFNPR